MNCFDPNRCACLRYDGRQQVPGGWRLTERPADFLACREKPTCGLKALRAFRDEENGPEDDSTRTESHHVGIETIGRLGLERCLQVHYTRSIGIRPEFYGSWAGDLGLVPGT